MQVPVGVEVDLEVYLHLEDEDDDPHTVLLVKPRLNHDFCDAFHESLELVKAESSDWNNTSLYARLRHRGWVFSVVSPQFVTS